MNTEDFVKATQPLTDAIAHLQSNGRPSPADALKMLVEETELLLNRNDLRTVEDIHPLAAKFLRKTGSGLPEWGGK